MALRPPLANQAIDERAATLCREVLDGSREERTVRRDLLEMAMSSTVIDECARSGSYAQRSAGQVPMDVQDLRDRLLDMLTDKILGREGIEFLDLRKIASGESFCGWAHNLMRNSVRFHRLRHFREYRSRGARETLMPHHSSSGPEGQVAGIDSVPALVHNVHGELFETAHSDPAYDARVEAVVEGFLADRPALRGNPLLIRQARTAVRGLGVRPPRAVGWRAPKARARVASLLESASDAELLGLLDMVSDQEMPPPGAERTFASMWTAHSAEEIERVRMFGAPTVRLLTRAAITPVPAPRQNSVRLLAAELARRCGLHVNVCSSLAGAWADSVCEMTGSEWSSDEIRQRTPEEMDCAASAFAAVAGRFLSFDDTLGTGVEELSVNLERIFEEVEVDRLSSREAQVSAGATARGARAAREPSLHAG